MIATRQQPECGHKMLRECPLNVEDWNDVFTAWLGFRYQCLLISERAHARKEKASRGAGAVGSSSDPTTSDEKAAQPLVSPALSGPSLSRATKNELNATVGPDS